MDARNIIKRLVFPVLAPVAKRYYSRSRPYRYKSLSVDVWPGVFHPGPIISTKILLDHLDQLDLEHKHVLELGAGCGIISLLMASKGAQVTASDVNQKGLENVQHNAEKHQLAIQTVFSDLFDQLDPNAFDLVVINPPYYPKNAQTDADKAWFCGADFGYFRKLFEEMTQREGSEWLMILSEDCQIEVIRQLGIEMGWELQEVMKKKVLFEWNYIFRIVKARN